MQSHEPNAIKQISRSRCRLLVAFLLGCTLPAFLGIPGMASASSYYNKLGVSPLEPVAVIFTTQVGPNSLEVIVHVGPDSLFHLYYYFKYEYSDGYKTGLLYRERTHTHTFTDLKPDAQLEYVVWIYETISQPWDVLSGTIPMDGYVYSVGPPIADAGPDREVAEGGLVNLDGANSTDPNGLINTYLWEQIGGNPVALSDPAAVSPTFTAPSPGPEALTFRLTVTDNAGFPNTDTDSCIVNVVNGAVAPPLADAGAGQTVNEGAFVALNGAGSTDSDGTIDTYLWEQTDGSTVLLSDPAAAYPTFTAPTAGTEVLAFLLTVTDDDGLKGTDTCLVNVTDEANGPPLADAGPDQDLTEGDTVTLDGTNSTDPEDGSVTSFLWTQTAGPSVTLSDTTVAEPTFVTPAVAADGTVLNFQLTVTDTDGLKAVDEVAVTVNDNSNSSSSGGCFIATAAYGSPIEPQINILREFRDGFMLKNSIGKAFVRLYYKYSPPLADFIAKRDNLRILVRLGLLPVVGLSWAALQIGPVFCLVLMLLFGSALVCFAEFRRKSKNKTKSLDPIF